MDVLEQFDPEIRRWFSATYRAPTDVQARSWPQIATGAHVLITAPTGSGKTLTAFLWAINAFATGASEPGATRVLYISPLKALNNDIRTNLVGPVTEIRARFADAGRSFPKLRVQTRSGDTEANERQRMLRRPPELLITTPESLTLLLTTVRGRQALSTVEAVILDEIHAVVENRRGVQLMTGLERLVEVAGEFQRIALSATVRPLEYVAEYVGGFNAVGSPRPVSVIASQARKAIDFRVRFPEAARTAADNGEKVWEPLSDSFKDVIESNHSTLFFTNSRRMAEKITLKLNDDVVAPLAYAHHGSLARDIRTEVETRLKDGELKAIVATNSLELGIDIGDLDEVVLVQSPPSIASALQRVGRAGHRVGEVSRGTLYPSHAQDFLEAAVVAKAIAERDLEPLRPIANPLDVLAQVLVSCTASEEWQTDALYALLTRAAPYATLAREQFDLVVEMLAGRYAGTRIRDLKPRVAFDRIRHTLKARKGAAFALYTSGGTIPDRGYFTLRHADHGTAIGELDEEFVWESSVGNTFTLGTRHWRVHRITHNDVLVKPAPPKSAAPPFWRAENLNRSFHFSCRIGEFLRFANEALKREGDDELLDELKARGFDDIAAEELIEYLKRQLDATQRDLPHVDHLLVEHVKSGPGGYSGPDREQQIVLHTTWGGRVNRPLALALEAAWRARFPGEADVHADNNAIVVQIKEDVDPALFLSLVTPANFESLLRESLEGSDFFGARFRECAGRALLLTKRSFKRRMPLWMTRLQAKKLLTATKPLADFPIVLETWRTCLKDEFDLEAAFHVLERLASGDLDWSLATVSSPSPFAAGIAFNQIGRYMYADDAPERGDRSALSDDLIRQAVFDHSLRPALTPEVIADFESRAQRTRAGYVPDGETELAEWVKERVAIPGSEWFPDTAVPSEVEERLVAGRTFIVHPEIALGEDPVRQAAEMLQFYGPRTVEELKALLPFNDIERILDDLVDGETLVRGTLVADDERIHLCDADNLETLIRFQRAAARPLFEARPVTDLAPFLARWHEFGSTRPAERIGDAVDRLRCYSAPVAFWLDDALSPRLSDGALERLETEGVRWRGTDTETVMIGFEDDLDLLPPPDHDNGQPEAHDLGKDPAGLFRDPSARYTFNQLLDESGESPEVFNAAFWDAVWHGRIAADGFSTLATGRLRSFRFDDLANPRSAAVRQGARAQHGQRHLRLRMRAKATAVSRGWPGTWYRVPDTASASDAIERLEENKERSRILLDRYGVVTREMANREGGVLRWAALFPALRIMELSGEVVSGLFFESLSGPQFALPQAVRNLERLNKAQATFWISALDPASPCGLGAGIEGLPQRRVGNHLGYFEGELAVVSETFARRLTIRLDVDDPGLDALLPNLARICSARKRLATETINGEPARSSPYLAALSRHLATVADHKGVYLESRF